MIIKENYQSKVKKYIHIKDLEFAKRNELIQKNPLYGEMICKCEKVSKGEIIDCLKRSCPPHSIKGLKKRLRVGFGKCQGGMCQADALNIMADYYHVSLNQIPYDSKKAYILLNELDGGDNHDENN